MHIPKTAGSAFRHGLYEMCRRARIPVMELPEDGRYPFYEEFLPLIESYVAEFKMIFCHAPLPWTLGYPVRVITVIRDPFYRIISHINHSMRADGKEGKTTINAFVKNRRNARFLRSLENTYVKYFAFGGSPESEHFDARTHLAFAMQNFKKVALCKDTEFDTLLKRFYVEGSDTPLLADMNFRQEKINTSKVRAEDTELEPEVIEKIKHMSAVDYELLEANGFFF
ncbi:MAG: hypothetical protein H6908_05690 [Hyphomicrobiales bacterium]|nr:hypothetical protein [Hyphomicrobiales bacterium]